MSTVTENDLRELRDLINSKFEQVNEKFEQVNEKFEQVNEKFEQVNEKFEQVNEKLNDMRVDIATLKEGQNSLNKRIDDTQTSINKRIDNLDLLARIIVGGVIVALVVGLIKFLYSDLTL